MLLLGLSWLQSCKFFCPYWGGEVEREERNRETERDKEEKREREGEIEAER